MKKYVALLVTFLVSIRGDDDTISDSTEHFLGEARFSPTLPQDISETVFTFLKGFNELEELTVVNKGFGSIITEKYRLPLRYFSTLYYKVRDKTLWYRSQKSFKWMRLGANKFSNAEYDPLITNHVFTQRFAPITHFDNEGRLHVQKRQMRFAQHYLHEDEDGVYSDTWDMFTNSAPLDPEIRPDKDFAPGDDVAFGRMLGFADLKLQVVNSGKLACLIRHDISHKKSVQERIGNFVRRRIPPVVNWKACESAPPELLTPDWFLMTAIWKEKYFVVLNPTTRVIVYYDFKNNDWMELAAAISIPGELQTIYENLNTDELCISTYVEDVIAIYTLDNEDSTEWRTSVLREADQGFIRSNARRDSEDALIPFATIPISRVVKI